MNLIQHYFYLQEQSEKQRKDRTGQYTRAAGMAASASSTSSTSAPLDCFDSIIVIDANYYFECGCRGLVLLLRKGSAFQKYVHVFKDPEACKGNPDIYSPSSLFIPHAAGDIKFFEVGH